MEFVIFFLLKIYCCFPLYINLDYFASFAEFININNNINRNTNVQSNL